jgi:uncharacterized iron-regulated membrane protein
MRWSMKPGLALFLFHQWLGLVSGVILLVVALTGVVLAFAPEMREGAYRQTVDSQDTAWAGVEAFRDTLFATFPEGDFRTITFRGRERTAEVLLFTPGTHHLAQLDPYTAELIHRQDMNEGFIQSVLRLHRNLLIKKPGQQVVHWATLIFFGLVVSGAVMKRGRNRWRGLKGWHVLVGYYGSIVALASIGTGLYWGFAPIKDAVKGLTGETARHYEQAESVLPADVTQPKRGAGGWRVMETLATGFRVRYPDQWVRVSAPHRPNDPVQVSIIAPPGGEGIPDQRYFDRYTGEEIQGNFEHELAADASRFQVVNRWAYAVHFGTWGGWAGRILMALSALAVASVVVSGWGMFFRRKIGRSSKLTVERP